MIKLIIIGELTSLNDYINAERSNKHIAAKMKKDNTYLCQWQLKGVKPIVAHQVHITFTWYCKDKKTDPDNTAWSKKFICDAMVNEGILENDGWKQIAGFTDRFEIDVKNPRVEVELWEIAL